MNVGCISLPIVFHTAIFMQIIFWKINERMYISETPKRGRRPKIHREGGTVYWLSMVASVTC